MERQQESSLVAGRGSAVASWLWQCSMAEATERTQPPLTGLRCLAMALHYRVDCHCLVGRQPDELAWAATSGLSQQTTHKSVLRVLQLELLRQRNSLEGRGLEVWRQRPIAEPEFEQPQFLCHQPPSKHPSEQPLALFLEWSFRVEYWKLDL